MKTIIVIQILKDGSYKYITHGYKNKKNAIQAIKTISRLNEENCNGDWIAIELKNKACYYSDGQMYVVEI